MPLPNIRVRWWNLPTSPYPVGDLALPESLGGRGMIDPSALAGVTDYPAQAPLVFFGHYWLPKDRRKAPLAPNLASQGHSVCDPLLSGEDFALALEAAQDAFATFDPEVVVGSSRGGAVAMNLDAGSVPLVLLCPARRRWGKVDAVPPGTIILHSKEDETVPFEDSLELLANSGLGDGSLVVTGGDHRLSDADSLRRLLDACRRCGWGGE